ncbi:MAG: LuxR C-terminal-related transcriptional regulator [Anaerolineae bacterium]
MFSSSVLLKTKLRRPRLPGDAIARPRLNGVFDSSPNPFLTLIVAPAGAGKSTVVSQWLAGCPSPVAWLSLDDGDNDLPLFLQYLLAAIQTALPHACRDLEPLLAAPTLPPLDILGRSIINSLAELPDSLVLVLDDMHTVSEPAILDLLDNLLKQRPNPLKLVITSRSELPLRLSRLRAQGQMVELHLDDLRFTPTEIQAFGRSSIDLDLTDEAAAALATQTEGWAAGVRLSLLSLAGDKEARELTPRTASRATVNYLVDEVLAHQSPAMQRFLLRISFLERFTVSLCDTILAEPEMEGSPSARTLLREVEKANLFLIPLDATAQWYRFHHLFRDMLFQRLRATVGGDDLRRLRRRASEWFARHDLPDEALQYALAAGDAEAAARIVEERLTALLNAEDITRLERWLAWLPEELVEQRPGLLVATAWLNRLRGRVAANEALLERVEQRLNAKAAATASPAVEILRGQTHTLRAEIAYWTDDLTDVIELGEQALAILPEEHLFARGLAEMYLLYAVYHLGFRAEAEGRLVRANHRDHLNAYTSRLAIADIVLGIHGGLWNRVDDAAHWLLDVSQDKGFSLGITWGRFGLGMASLERNQLDAAFQHFSVVASLIYSTHLRAGLNGLLALGLIRQALGQPEQADAAIAEAERVAARVGAAELFAEVRSTRARLCLVRGDPTAALPIIVAPTNGSTALTHLLWFESPAITQARVFLAQRTPEYQARAEVILAELLGVVRSRHLTRREIEVLVLTALAHEQAGRRGSAVECLGQAVQLAETRGAVRFFVEIGPPLVPLLDSVASRGVAPRFAGHLLAAIAAASGGESGVPGMARAQSAEPHLVEPLTNREMDVLEALAHRRTNKEIAAELFISPTTVQRHLSNIFQKLNADNRRDAVKRAQALGILT